MPNTSRRSLLQLLPTVLTFGLFESRVLAEAGVRSPVSLAREVFPEVVYTVSVRGLDETGDLLEEFYPVTTVAKREDARPYVLTLLQELLCVIEDFDDLLAASLPRNQNERIRKVSTWLWQVWKIRDADMANRLIADAEFGDLPGVIYEFPHDLTPQELDDLTSMIDLDELIRVEETTLNHKEAWSELEEKSKAGVEIATRYARIKKAPGTFLRLCQENLIRTERETDPEITEQEIRRRNPLYFPEPDTVAGKG